MNIRLENSDASTVREFVESAEHNLADARDETDYQKIRCNVMVSAEELLPGSVQEIHDALPDTLAAFRRVHAPSDMNIFLSKQTPCS